MPDIKEIEKKTRPLSNNVRVSLIPFTGGLICFVYAFFWPEGYGTWLGTIVRAFRIAAGV